MAQGQCLSHLSVSSHACFGAVQKAYADEDTKLWKGMGYMQMIYTMKVRSSLPEPSSTTPLVSRARSSILLPLPSSWRNDLDTAAQIAWSPPVTVDPILEEFRGPPYVDPLPTFKYTPPPHMAYHSTRNGRGGSSWTSHEQVEKYEGIGKVGNWKSDESEKRGLGPRWGKL